MRRLILAALVLLSGCAPAPAPGTQATARYPDGVYRGAYYDYSTEQLAVEFEMKDQRFEEIRFIGMRYRDGDYLSADATQAQRAIVAQYEAAASYLRQKGVGALTELYQKPDIVPDIDAVTGATLKSSAVVSAIHDGLSRMPYGRAPDGAFAFGTPVCDGLYRGFYYVNGIERVAVEFDLADRVFTALRLRALKDEYGRDCAENDRAYQTVRECLLYLENKPLSALDALDGVAARLPAGDPGTATLLRCAIFGGLSRAPFQSEDATPFFERFLEATGTYRGHYYDRGAEQLSVQFEMDRGRLYNIALRGKQESLTESAQLERYRQACLLLEGKPVTAVNSLYRLSDAAFEAGELTYAIADALARGLYKPSNASLLPVMQRVAEGTRRGSFQSEALTVEVALQLQRDGIVSAELTRLKIEDARFGDEAQAARLLTEQLEQLAGKPFSQINKLYQWEHPLALPLIGALWDAIEAE